MIMDVLAGDKNPATIFMETEFDKKKAVAGVLGFEEWLYFISPKDYGESDFNRIEIYSGKIQVRDCRKWIDDVFGYVNGSTLRQAESVYEK